MAHPGNSSTVGGVVLTEAEFKVLSEFGDSDEWCYGFDHLAANCGLDRQSVRDACRSLAARGLARFARGLMTEDGEVAGSGYGPTMAGKRAHWNTVRAAPDTTEPQVSPGMNPTPLPTQEEQDR